ncbi:MAG: carbohydrate ABC transporter substrate-binding protein [Candidatus Bathyarchaeota archaeon]|nr:MAG: carbohydrate ABC transporter substrate-binding protein [Candidatus Bathyarchaeota archaeon]
MATNTEIGIAVLVIIGIIVSASTLFYTLDLTSRIAAIEEKLPPTLTVIGPWAGKEMEAFLPALQRFERLTGYKVVFKTFRAEDLAPILPAQFAAKKALGDVIFMWASFIREQAPDGHILEVTDQIDKADFSTGTYDPVTVDGKLWGGAYTGKVKPGFWYRNSTFAKYNLTQYIPAANGTYADFVTLLNKIEDTGAFENPIVSGDKDGWPLTDATEHFLITYGDPQLQKDLLAGDVSWTSTEVRAIFADRLVPLLAGNFSEPIDWTTGVELLWEEEYALYFMGSWITGMVDDPDDLGVFSLPGVEGFVFAADYFFIPAYTEHPEEAKELLDFLVSEEAQSVQVAQGGHLATNLDVPLTAYPVVDKRVAELMVGKELLLDLDDTIGGEFQTTLWSQLRLLWTSPTALDSVLAAIEAKAP